MRTIKTLIGLVMLGTAISSAALTVGRVRGAAWIGQPLTLSIPVQLESGTTDSALCAEADVFYADFKQDSSRVRVSQEPDGPGDTRLVQIYSATAIDEPMVTVYLRVGCAQKVSRRFVLLADYLPSVEVATPQAPVIAQIAPAPTATESVPRATQLPLATDNPALASEVTTTRPAKSAAVQSAPRSAAAKPPAASKPAPQQAPTKAAATPALQPKAPARARLKLDPIENLAERVTTLETTTTALPLEDLARDAQRMQQLQNDVKALLQQAAKNEASLAAMRERLEKAEADRVPASLIYGMAALLIVCLAVIIILWNRRNPNPSWRQEWPMPEPEETARPVKAIVPADVPPVPSTSPAPIKPVNPPDPLPKAEFISSNSVDVDLIEMDGVSYGELMNPTATKPGDLDVVEQEEPAPLPLLPSLLPHQAFDSEQQFDLRQQAEFFERLAKTDEAIEALEKRIRSNSKDCPLVYLELLRIANTHSLKTDFRQFRDECQKVFNVDIPEFALFRNEGRGLDAHPSLMAHIAKLWPTPQVLDVLESCILRDPWEKNAEPFDLAAFKDLVLLHGIALQLTRTDAQASGSESEPLDLLL